MCRITRLFTVSKNDSFVEVMIKSTLIVVTLIGSSAAVNVAYYKANAWVNAAAAAARAPPNAGQ